MSIPTPSFTSSEPDGAALVRRTPMTDGPCLRKTRYRRRLRRYRLVYNPGQLNETSLATLVAQYESAKGGAGSFDYTPFQASSPVKVTFADGSLNIRVSSSQRFSATVVLEEVPLA